MKYIILILVIIFFGIYLRVKDAHTVKKERDTNTTKIERGKNMELNTKVKEQWQRLFYFYKNSGLLVKKCEGVAEEKLAEFEKEFKVILPKAFADSFRICDERYIFNTSEKKGWFGEDDIYSLNCTKFDGNNLFQANRQIATYAKDIGWNKNWIQFYDYGTWFGAVLDTVTGKIYCYENETGEYVIWANSYEEWLEMAVDEVLKYGEIRLELIEKLMGIE